MIVEVVLEVVVVVVREVLHPFQPKIRIIIEQIHPIHAENHPFPIIPSSEKGPPSQVVTRQAEISHKMDRMIQNTVQDDDDDDDDVLLFFFFQRRIIRIVVIQII